MMEQRDNRMETLLAQTVQDVMTMSMQAGANSGEEALSRDSNMGFGLVEDGGLVILPLQQQLKSGCAFGTSARPP